MKSIELLTLLILIYKEPNEMLKSVLKLFINF